MRPPLPIRIFFALLLLSAAAARLSAAAPDYAAVHALFAQHCLDCHAAQDPEGKLVLENFGKAPATIRLIDRLPSPKGTDIKLTLVNAKDAAFDRTAAIYKLAGAEAKFKRE